MEVTRDDLQATFGGKTTDELLELRKSATLTRLARDVLEQELGSRGISAPSGPSQEKDGLSDQESAALGLQERPAPGRTPNGEMQHGGGSMALELLYKQAVGKGTQQDTREAKELFNRLVDEYPDSTEAAKAKLHLDRISRGKPKGIPGWVVAVPVVVVMQVGKLRGVDPKNMTILLLVAAGFFILYWAWAAWNDPEIDAAEQKIAGMTGWLWFIGVTNIGIGLLAKFHIWQPYELDWVVQTTFGAGFLLLAAIIARSRNSLTVAAAMLGIVIWGGDTVLLGSDVILSGFKVAIVVYIMLAFHIVILSSMMRGLSGLRGSLRLQEIRHTVTEE